MRNGCGGGFADYMLFVDAKRLPSLLEELNTALAA
jgi:hypothetical protein